jgi:hypothetical protein
MEELKVVEYQKELEVRELSSLDKKYLKKFEAGHIEDTLKEEIKTQHNYYRALHYDIDSTAGLIYKNYDLISKQRKVIHNIMQEGKTSLICGGSILMNYFPLSIYEPYTLLDLLAEQYTYTPSLLLPVVGIEDPLEKMKGVMVWIVASMHLGINQSLPCNSILGETLQGKIGNVEVCGELISVNPLISSFMLAGKDIFIYSTHKVEAYAYPNSVQGGLCGKKVVQVLGMYPATYKITSPQVEIEGISFGKRSFKYTGKIVIEDTVNDLYGVICVNPIKKGFFANLFGSNDHRADYIKGFITKERRVLKDAESVVFKEVGHEAVCEGYWIESLSFDGKVVWEIDRVKSEVIKRPKNKMLSDSSLRLDVQALKRGDNKEAQRIRSLLNNAQKEDKKLRRKSIKKKE